MAKEETKTQTSEPQNQTAQAPPKQGMSSGAKWGIGIGACCCCLIIVAILILILGFTGCSMFQFGGFRGWNWPEAPPIDYGPESEAPIPSFSNTPR